MTARSMTMPLLSIISLAAASSVLDLLRDFLWEVLVDIVPEKKKRKKKEAKVNTCRLADIIFLIAHD